MKTDRATGDFLIALSSYVGMRGGLCIYERNLTHSLGYLMLL